MFLCLLQYYSKLTEIVANSLISGYVLVSDMKVKWIVVNRYNPFYRSFFTYSPAHNHYFRKLVLLSDVITSGNTHEILSSLAFEEKWKLSGSLHSWEREHQNFYGSFSWVDTCGIVRSITYGFQVEEKKTLPCILLHSLSVELRRFDFDIVLRSYR